MMQSPEFVPFSVPAVGKEEEEAVLRVLRSGWLTTGKEALAFESEFAQKTGAAHALAVNSATSGLLLAYQACGADEKTRILTTPYTFVSTATAARHLGAEVVYADIEADSYNISPAHIEKILAADAKNGATIKIVVPVHIAGNVCKMTEICAIAKKYGVRVVEDAAHAFPSKTSSGYAGTLGDVGVYSFYATKTITTAEGGMVCTNNAAFASRMNLLRMHGIDRTVWDRYTSEKAAWEYDVLDAGWKCNLPDILAAMGREQLKKAETLFESRRRIVERYNRAFGEFDFFKLPPDGEGNAWHLYLLRLESGKLSISRNEFSNLLQKQGLGVSMHFIPHYHFTYWKNRYNLSARDFPNAEKCYQTTITLPLWPGMDEEAVERVIRIVSETGQAHAK